MGDADESDDGGGKDGAVNVRAHLYDGYEPPADHVSRQGPGTTIHPQSPREGGQVDDSVTPRVLHPAHSATVLDGEQQHGINYDEFEGVEANLYDNNMGFDDAPDIGEDEDEEEDSGMNPSEWRKTPMKGKDFSGVDVTILNENQILNNQEQQDISERGPRLSLGAVCKVGSVQSHLVAWRNGLGRVTFLQSSDPNLSYGHFNYMTPSTEHEYAKKFKHAVDTLSVNPNYDPTELLSEREKERRLVHDAHDVLEATKGQVDPSWFGVKHNTLSDDVMGRNVEPSSTEIVVGNSDALDTVK